MNSHSLFLGIDLGTTNSAAAIFDGTQTHLTRTSQGMTLTPSVVRVDSKGAITVGSRARRVLESDPENVRGEFKRLMGSGQRLTFPASGRSFSPEELSAEILKSLRTDVREQFGFEPACAVISAPALFELPQSTATGNAARLAGFERVELIQEPIASALAAGWTTRDAVGSWMVYDLGGGTFDASLLETRDGLLRVVGHDGDNFLGGRDFDWALLDFVLEQLSRKHSRVFRRSDPLLANTVRRLKNAIEDARIELTREEQMSLFIPNLALGTEVIEVDIVLTRADVERLCLPLVDRSIAVCQRLLAGHGLEPSQVSKLVLVGGPTVMPLIRRRLTETLAIPFATGLDPMTLVAQGAALYAAGANLNARPATVSAPETGQRVWLQYPAMTSDLTPYVVGRFAEGQGERPTQVRVEREDGWKSPHAAVSEEGAFAIAVDVLPHQSNMLTLVSLAESGAAIPVSPSQFAIVHGLTLSDPPLSRAIGVALASNFTHTYFERGAPLPARRSFRHQAVDTLVKGDASSVLRIPIIQGEFHQAHLCRLVGALEIRGNQLTANIPAGSFLEVTLEVDRGGQLSARALTESGQIFEEIARLRVPEATPEALEEGIADARRRLARVYGLVGRDNSTELQTALGALDLHLTEIASDIAAARGGDHDAAQKAKRGLLDVDASLENLEQAARFPELERQATQMIIEASFQVSTFGLPREQKMFEDTAIALQNACKARQLLEIQRLMRQIQQIGAAAHFKDPNAWNRAFNQVASRISLCRDLPLAEQLVKEGREALAKNDRQTLQRCTMALWSLMPADSKARQLGHDSGLR